MLPNFRSNLRGTSENRSDITFMNILFIKLSVDGICTASVATGDPGNYTKNHSNRIWMLAQSVLFNFGVGRRQQNILPKMTRATSQTEPIGRNNNPRNTLEACKGKWSELLAGISAHPGLSHKLVQNSGGIVGQMVGHMVGQMIQNCNEAKWWANWSAKWSAKW